jgi:hypothetical protein
LQPKSVTKKSSWESSKWGWVYIEKRCVSAANSKMQEDEMADATGSKLCTTDDVDHLQQTFFFSTLTLQDEGLLAGGHLVELCGDSGTLQDESSGGRVYARLPHALAGSR